MNIMKTEMLLFDNRVKKENAGSTAVMTPAPAPAENPEEGMNLLTFKGLQNLMANPKLAEEVGVANEGIVADKDSAKEYVAPFSSNLAFKSTKTKALQFLTGAVMAAAMTSCNIEIPEDKDKGNVNILFAYQNNEAVAQAIANLNSQIAALRAELAERDAAQAERDRKMIELLTNAVTFLDNVRAQLEELNKNALTKEDYDKGIEDIKKSMSDSNSAIVQAISLALQISNENAQKMVDDVMSKIGTIVNGAEYTFAQAMEEIQKLMSETNSILRDWREDYNNERITASEWRKKLLGQLGDIWKVIGEFLKEFVTRDDENKQIWKDIRTEAEKNNANWAELMPKVDAYIRGEKQRTELVLLLHQDLKQLNQTVIKSKDDLVNATGVGIDVFVQAIQMLGYSLEEAMSMDVQTMLDVFNKAIDNQNNVIIQVGENAGQRVDSLAVYLTEILGKWERHEINDEQALELLKNINQGVQDINSKFDQFIDMFKNAFKSLFAKLNQLVALAGKIERGVGINIAISSDIDRQLHSMGDDIKNLKQSAIEIRNALKNGEITVRDPQVVALLQQLDIDVNASKEEVVARLDEVITNQENNQAAIEKLDKNNQSKLDYVASLIQNITPDNSDLIAAINDLKNTTEENFANVVNALTEAADKLINLVNGCLEKLDGISASVNLWGKQIADKLGPCGDIVKAIKENGKKIDYNNMTQAQLLAEVKILKPQIQTLVTNTTLANSYLEFMAGYAPQIKESIDNIQNIGGGGITAEQMDALMKKYTEDMKKYETNLYSNFTTTMNNMHIESMLKLAEGIEYQKEGSETALAIYNLLLNKMQNPENLSVEELKALLKAIYEYLPELKCQCTNHGDCDHNKDVTEEILGNLK